MVDDAHRSHRHAGTARDPAQKYIPFDLGLPEEPQVHQRRALQLGALGLAPHHDGPQLAGKLGWRWPRPVYPFELVQLEVEDVFRDIEHADAGKPPAEFEQRPPEDRQDQRGVETSVLADLGKPARLRQEPEEGGPYGRTSQEGM